MNADPLDPALAAWCASRRESHAPAGCLAHALALLTPPRPAQPVRSDRWRAPALAAGGAWLLARLASLLLPFLVR
jgi:hypothetical protein